jgi:O-antigen/teichoic acid export membrane protein
MQKKFLSNLFLIVVLNLLVKPFYILGIDAEVQNRVGEAIYGNYFSLLNFSFLLNILLDLGLTNFNARNIAQHPQQVAKHFGKLLSLRFLLFFLYAAATGLAGFFIGFSAEEGWLLSILIINQFLVAIVQFARSNLAGLHLFRTDAFISVLDRLLLILICSALLWTNWFGGEMKIEWFVYAQTLAYGVAAFISVAVLLYQIDKVRFQLKKVFSLYILKQSFPYALLILLMMMYNRIDAVMLERLLPNGDEAAGVYAQGFRLLDAVNMFALLFAGLLLPIFARLIRNKEGVNDMVKLAFRILFGISVVVGMTCYFYQGELIDLRYPGAAAESAEAFGYLILSFIPVSMTYVFGTLLTANGSLKYLNYMALGGVVLNIVFNFILIETYGVVGAALATLVTQSITAAAQMVLANLIFKLSFGYRLKMALFGLVGILFLTQTQFITAWANPWQGFFILLGLGIVLLFALGFIRLGDLRMVFQRAEDNA